MFRKPEPDLEFLKMFRPPYLHLSWFVWFFTQAGEWQTANQYRTQFPECVPSVVLLLCVLSSLCSHVFAFVGSDPSRNVLRSFMFWVPFWLKSTMFNIAVTTCER